MKKDFWLDYLACTGFKLLGPVIRVLPWGAKTFLGKALGEWIYFFDSRHRAITLANLKQAFGAKLSRRELKRLSRDFYRNYGQNFIDIFLIPGIDKKYLEKYIEIQGRENTEEVFKKGKGVIFVSVHAGSWELSNIICSNLGFAFSLFVRPQKGFARLNRLLNSYRKKRGCRIIEKGNQTRQLVQMLKTNEAIGMTVDQGGRAGMLVKFFGKNASMPTGAVRLALRYGAVIVPVFYTRSSGHYHKIIVKPGFVVEKTGNLEQDIRNNLERLVNIFEKYILAYPKEYLWTYKIWKYSDEKNILLLNDGKAGHLRQAQAVVRAVSDCLAAEKIKVSLTTPEGVNPDIVVSCGSSLAGLNYRISRQALSKSIVVMRPALLPLKKFDLVIMPRHDQPPKRKNVVVTDGALNLIDKVYLEEQSGALLEVFSPMGTRPSAFNLGLLAGGDTKGFRLDKAVLEVIISQLKQFAREFNAGILASTSRRTSVQIEQLFERQLADEPNCRLLVIANRKNYPFTVGGILGLTDILIVSPESISMVSEAASAGRYVIVFDAPVSRRHRIFLKNLAQEKYIYLVKPQEIFMLLKRLKKERPPIKRLDDREKLKEALSRIL